MLHASLVHGQEKASGDTQLRYKAVGTDYAPENQASESCGAQGSVHFRYCPFPQENGVTCVFTYAAVGGTNEVGTAYAPFACYKLSSAV